MPNELEATNTIWKLSYEHRDMYHEKLVDLHKVIISVSGVMLSILAVFSNQKGAEFFLLIQLAAILFLLSVMFGVLSLHGHAEFHQKVIDEIGALIKDNLPSKVVEKARISNAGLNGLYPYAHSITIVSFFLGLTSLSCYSLL